MSNRRGLGYEAPVDNIGAVPVRHYRLTRNFAIGALIVVCLAAVGLADVNRRMGVEQLERMAEQNNLALTQTFANSVWPQFRSFIESASNLAAADIR